MKRRWRWCLFLAALVVLAAFVAWLSVEPIARSQITRALRSELGVDVTIGKLSGPFLNEIRAEDVELRDPAGSALVSARAAVVQARFDLWALVRRRPGWLKSITVDSPVVSIDVDRPEPLAWRRITRGGRGGPAPRVRVERGRIDVQSRHGAASAEGLAAELAPADAGGIVIPFACERATASVLDRNVVLNSLRGEIDVAHGAVRIPFLRDAAGAIARDISIIAPMAPGERPSVENRPTTGNQQGETPLRIAGTLVSAEGSLDLAFDVAPRETRIVAAARNVDVEKLRRVLQLDAPPISGRVDGELVVALVPDSNAPRVAADLELSSAAWNGRPLGHVAMGGSLRDGRLVVDRARVENGEARLEVHGLLDRTGVVVAEARGDIFHARRFLEETGILERLRLSDADLRGRLLASVGGTVVEPRATLRVEEGAITIDGIDASFAHADASSLPGVLTLGVTDLVLGDDRVSAAGTVVFGSSPVYDAGATIDLADVAHYSSAFPTILPPIDGGLRAVLRASGPWAERPSRWRIDAELREGSIARVPIARAAVSAEQRDDTIDVETLSVALAADDVSIDASARIDLAIIPRIEVARAEGIAFGEPWRLASPASVTFDGGTLAASPIAIDAPAGRVQVEGSLSENGDVSARAIVESLDLNRVRRAVARRVSLPEFGGAAAGEIELSGTTTTPSFDAEFVVPRLSVGAVAVSDVSVRTGYEGGVLGLESLSAGLPEGDVDASGSVRGTIVLVPPQFAFGDLAPLRFTARGHGLRLATLLNPGTGDRLVNGVDGDADVELFATGSVGHPIVEGSLSIANGAVDLGGGKPPLSHVKLRLDARDGVLSVADASATLGSATLRIDGRVGYSGIRPTDVDLRAEVSDLALESVVDPRLQELAGVASVMATMKGTAASPEVDFSATIRDLVYHGARASGAEMSGRIAEAAIDVERLIVHSAIGDLVGRGRLPFDLTLDPLRAGVPEAGTIEGSISTGRTDLAFLADVWPLLRRATGTASAEIRVEGPVRSPGLFGTLEVHDGTFRFQRDFPSVDRLEGRVLLSGTSVSLENVSGEMGHGPVRLEGRVDWGSGLEYDLTLHTEDALVVDGGGLRARANADLHAHTDATGAHIDGSITLRRSLLSTRVSTSRQSSGPSPLVTLPLDVPEPFRDVSLDVKVSGTDDVTVENNVVRADLDIDGKLTGTLSRPILDSTVRLRSGRIKLPTADFVVRNGQITFYSNDPWRPYLDVSSEARIGGYQVNLDVNGPTDAPRLDLTSEPPLPYEDVVALVSTGYTRTKLRDAGVGGVVAGQGLRYVSKSATQSGSPIEQALGGLADRVTFQPETRQGGPGASHFQGTAEVKLSEVFFLQAQKDEFGHYNFDLVFRLRFQ